MSISGKIPVVRSYQNQFDNGIYVTKGPVVLPDGSIDPKALASTSGSTGVVTIGDAQTITGQKRFSQQILGDSISLSSGASNKRVLTSDASGNATWQDPLTSTANAWTGTNTYNTVIPTTTLTPTGANDLVPKNYVDIPAGTFSIVGYAVGATPIYTFTRAYITDFNYVPYQRVVTMTPINWNNNSLTLINLGNVGQIPGAFSLTSTGLTSFIANQLIAVDGNFTFNCTACTTVDVSKLLLIVGTLAFTCGVNATVSFTSLKAILGNATHTLTLTGSASINFSALSTFVGTLQIVAGAPTLAFPALTTCGNLFINDSGLVGTMTFPSLTSVGYVNINSFGLTSMTFPAIVSFTATTSGYSIINNGATELVTFSFGPNLKSIAGNVGIQPGKLSAASVDGILISLAALDGTNGTTAWSSKTVYLAGGTSAAPTSASLAARTALIARGCTVTTN